MNEEKNINNPRSPEFLKGDVRRSFKGYASCGNWIGDVRDITDEFVIIQPFRSNKIGNPEILKKLKRGLGKIKFIEFGSFNPNMYNYKFGGNIVGVD